MDIQCIEIAERKALEWLIQANDRVNRSGFSHSRNIYLPNWMAWDRAYPETSGYLIENLLYYNNPNSDSNLIERAYLTAQWLCKIQAKNGAYHSGTGFKIESSFNTAQIIFGLNAASHYFKEDIFIDARHESIQYLLSGIHPSGKWTQGLYQNNFFSCYYTRAIWPILCCKDILSNPDINKLSNSLNYLFEYKNEFRFFDNSGFYTDGHSLSHTIGYCLEGFYESSLILSRHDITDYIIGILTHISDIIIVEKKLSAIFDNRLKPVASYECLTGNFQIISLLFKVNSRYPNPKFIQAAMILFSSSASKQICSRNIELNGAFPASSPVYAKYFPLRAVNWTNKFFLDACYQYKLHLLSDDNHLT